MGVVLSNLPPRIRGRNSRHSGFLGALVSPCRASRQCCWERSSHTQTKKSWTRLTWLARHLPWGNFFCFVLIFKIYYTTIQEIMFKLAKLLKIISILHQQLDPFLSSGATWLWWGRPQWAGYHAGAVYGSQHSLAWPVSRRLLDIQTVWPPASCLSSNPMQRWPRVQRHYQLPSGSNSWCPAISEVKKTVWILPLHMYINIFVHVCVCVWANTHTEYMHTHTDRYITTVNNVCVCVHVDW